ncbi:MAG: GNAT family N-acetyltransferase [Candidatus Bathyarchaeota archaeon]|nr:GNAT family N-acetyltransferase [Candidatus Bathyarchaeota archaeon]MDH5786792.1 GNAT family N-acetyltransferase [Candidatus Bathyarchaeota archaeon]
MKIVSLGPAYEPIFWKYVIQDIPYYYFFAFDWKYNRDQTQILLALEENRIDGMMLVYRQYIVQFRGGNKAIRTLLKKLDLKTVELQALEQHKPYILEKYKPTVAHEMMLMILHKGEEKPNIVHPLIRLNASDAEHIATIMTKADPEFWGKVTAQSIIEGINVGVIWLGTKTNGKLVSIGNARLTEWGGLIGVAATDEAHRNKGYATSIVSELTKQILEKSPIAMIYVLRDNPPAIRAYEKVGFNHYKTFFFMRGEKR